MRFRSLAGASALALSLLPACSSTSPSPSTEPHAARESAATGAPASMTEEEAMAKVMELAATGGAHAELAARAGEWTVDYRYRWGPDAPWTPAQGSVSSKPVLGGRYLMEEHALSMMGMPMQGLSFLGYDNSTKQYTSLWMDTSSTWWVEARGTKSADGVTTYSGTMKDIAGERPYRMKTWSKPDGSMESEMYDTIAGREVLVMTYTLRRKP